MNDFWFIKKKLIRRIYCYYLFGMSIDNIVGHMKHLDHKEINEIIDHINEMYV